MAKIYRVASVAPKISDKLLVIWDSIIDGDACVSQTSQPKL